jgi:hypothetical protein
MNPKWGVENVMNVKKLSSKKLKNGSADRIINPPRECPTNDNLIWNHKDLAKE